MQNSSFLILQKFLVFNETIIIFTHPLRARGGQRVLQRLRVEGLERHEAVACVREKGGALVDLCRVLRGGVRGGSGSGTDDVVLSRRGVPDGGRGCLERGRGRLEHEAGLELDGGGSLGGGGGGQGEREAQHRRGKTAACAAQDDESRTP